MDFRGIMGTLYRICEWIMRLAMTNLLWVVCSFPIFVLGLTALLDRENAIQLLILASLLSPLFLFPSTSAMFTVSRKWVMSETDAPIFRTFFRGYKENFFKSLFGGLIFLLLGILIYIDFQFFINQTSILKWFAFVFITLSALLIAAAFFFFSIVAHFHMTFWQVLKNSLLMAISNPATSIAILVTNFLVLYVSLGTKFTFLVPFFMGSIMSTVTFWHFYRIFSRIQAQQEQSEDEETEDEGDFKDDRTSVTKGEE